MSDHRFEDSSDATGHIDTIGSMLADCRLVDWVKSTRDNFDTPGEAIDARYQKLLDAYDHFVSGLEASC